MGGFFVPFVVPLVIEFAAFQRFFVYRKNKKRPESNDSRRFLELVVGLEPTTC